MSKRTTEEILCEIERLKDDDWMGFRTGDLIQALPFESAQPFLKEGTTADQWAQSTDPAGEIKNYMEFAWDKANGCRGLSAGRSVNHMESWLWLDGKDELSARLESVYEYYGKPCLVLVCKEYGIDWKALDDGEWRNDESGPSLTAEQALAKCGLAQEVAA
jgi:hypothetical protein